MAISTATPPTDVADSYAKLEEKVLERDQKGASEVFYDLVRAGARCRRCSASWCASTRRTRTCRTTSASTTGSSAS